MWFLLAGLSQKIIGMRFAIGVLIDVFVAMEGLQKRSLGTCNEKSVIHRFRWLFIGSSQL